MMNILSRIHTLVNSFLFVLGLAILSPMEAQAYNPANIPAVPTLATLANFTATQMAQYPNIYVSGTSSGSTVGASLFTFINPYGSSPNGTTIIAPSDHSGVCTSGCMVEQQDSAGAATIKGNPTSSTGGASYFTIQSQTENSTPNITADFLPIYNHTTHTIQKTSAADLVNAVAPGVQSINGNTGLFTTGGGLVTSGNTINSPGGPLNLLRNSTYSFWNYLAYLTDNDSRTTTPNFYVSGITGAIAGSTTCPNGNASSPTCGVLTVTHVSAGTLGMWNEITGPSYTISSGSYNSSTGVVTLTLSSSWGSVATGSTFSLTVLTGTGNYAALTGSVQAATSASSGTTLVFDWYASQPAMTFTGGQVNTVLGDTEIIGMGVVHGNAAAQCGGSACTGTGSTGTYLINLSQTVASVGMAAAGSWSADGIYVIPVGSAGSAVNCGPEGSGVSHTVAGGLVCQVSVTGITDIIYRYTLNETDSAKILCTVVSGPACHGTTSFPLNPVTFTTWLFYETINTYQPSLTAYAASGPQSGNPWQTSVVDLANVNLQQNPTPANAKLVSYTWVPNAGPFHDGETVDFHCGAVAYLDYCKVIGTDFRSTPGATCAGTAPPCLQNNPPPLELAEYSADLSHNNTYDYQGWSYSQQGITDDTYAVSSTATITNLKYPVDINCNPSQLSPGVTACSGPNNIYFSWGYGPASIAVNMNIGSGSQINPTGVSVNAIYSGSAQLEFTGLSGLTAGQAGTYQTSGRYLVDGAYIGP